MVKIKHIMVISPNCLECVGLKAILNEYFSMTEVFLSNGYDEYTHSESENRPDLIFLPPDIYVLHEYFQNIKSRIVILLNSNEGAITNQPMLSYLDIRMSESEIVDNLNQIFESRNKIVRHESNEELSGRETEVLKLVARGLMSKQIADILSISLHTVISHRKNITRKLGINSVSGLTVFALLNGLISTEELE